jgi:catalase (peroxidase I)
VNFRQGSLLAQRPSISAALIEIALRDCTNFDADRGGGANGCIRLGAERKATIGAGLQGAMALIDGIHGEFADRISWTDILYMAAAVALERRGVENLLVTVCVFFYFAFVCV